MATSEFDEGDPIPVIDPPVTATLLDAWVAIVPRPRLVLAVEAVPISLKLFEAVNLVPSCVCAFEDKEFIY